MNDSKFAVARLHQLNSKLDRVLEFRARDNDEPSTAGKIAKGAAVAGGLGLAGYGAASYMRGNRQLAKGLGRPLRSMNERMAALRIGSNMNVSDAKAAMNAVRQNAGPRVQQATDYVKQKAGQAGDATKGAYEKVKSKLYRGSR